MTFDQANERARVLWGDDVVIGIARWRRSRSPRFRVGVCFTDGRPPQIRGESNVDWESAFAQAIGVMS